MRLLRSLLSFIPFSLILLSTVAQGIDACTTIVESALDTSQGACEELGRNEACYGNSTVDVTPYGTLPEPFDSPGDKMDIASIKSLKLGSMIEPDEWGIALMKVQANLPEATPGQNVTMVLIGNVYIENEVKSFSELKITAINTVNLRKGAGTNFDLAGVLNGGEEATVNGRNEAGDWLRVKREGEENAWVFAPLISVDGDSSTLTVVEASGSIPEDFSPMQAFYLLSGIGDAGCREASESGLLIQTPRGAGQINFLINEVEVRIGSTAFIQAQPGDFLTVSLLEGSTSVTNDDETTRGLVGAQIAVPLDENGRSTDPPQHTAYNPTAIEALPLEMLDEPVDLPTPLTDEEVNAEISCQAYMRERNRNAHVGPGRNRGALLELPFDQKFRVIGQAPDSEGETWYRLQSSSVIRGVSYENIWVATSDVKSIGGCRGVEQAEIPPIILATAGAGADVTPLSGSWRMTVVSAESTGRCPLVPIGTEIPIQDTPCYSSFIGSFNRGWSMAVADDELSMTLNGGYPYENLYVQRVSPTNFSTPIPGTRYKMNLTPVSENEMVGVIESFSIRINVSFVREG